jgi:hypothetical protein
MQMRLNAKASDKPVARLWLPRSVSMPWLFWFVLQLFLAISEPADATGLARVVSWSVSALLALTAIAIVRRERNCEHKAMFAGFTLFFGLNGFLVPSYYFFLKNGLSASFQSADFYFFQYTTILYFVFLSFVVLETAVSVGTRLLVRPRQLVSVGFTVAICLFFFGPYLADPFFLYRQSDFNDYLAISAVVKEMKKGEVDEYSDIEISSKVRLLKREQGKAVRTLSLEETQARVRDLAPSLKGGYVTGLFYRPLYAACVNVAGVCLTILICFVISTFFKDPPKGAFLEKIAWSLLPYVVLEGLHYEIYKVIYRREAFSAIQEIGGYLSTGIMLVILLLFVARLKFISSVEGRFYEGRVTNDALGITRWRDVVDNWVLRQFMDVSDLDRRFVIRGESHEQKEPDKKPKETI